MKLAMACGVALGWAIAAPVSAAPATGLSLYDANCSICHQGAGAGAPGQFPKLSGRVAVAAANPRGRAYLAHVVLNGMSGRIMVGGVPVIGVMPSFAQLKDDEIASVLNYLTTLAPAGAAKSAKFTAKEVELLRKKPLNAQEISAERRSLVDAKVLP
jgi:mono/diheme cytochrome c family protein